MEIQRHFETGQFRKLRELAQIRIMIQDLDQRVRALESDIADEEKRAGISDRFDASYPIIARTLIARRDNLKVTISALEERLAKVNEVLTDAAEQPARAFPCVSAGSSLSIS